MSKEAPARTGIVHSILESTAEGVLRELARAPSDVAYVEIRADRLRAPECAGLVAACAVPAIVTVREVSDGGGFTGSAAEKRAILEAALHAGAAFVDVEAEGSAADLAEGRWAPRAILSHHGGPCEREALTRRLDRMRSSRAARLKIVPEAGRAGEIAALPPLLREAAGRLALFASGRAGAASRIFALAWGSWGTYGAVAPGRESAPGQLTTRSLVDVYRVLAIGPATRRFALVGTPVLESPSPAMHAAGFSALALDAVYVPLECDDLDDASVLDLHGLAVTTPLKGAAFRRCARVDADSRSGAVNTVRIAGSEWAGHNTDVAAARRLLAPLLRTAGRRVAIAGAGDSARALGGMLAREGADVTLYARNVSRAEEAAAAVGARAASLDRLAGASWDVLVQATPLGRNGEGLLPAKSLTGAAVLDLAYGRAATPLVSDARARGLRVIDGHAFLLEQALLQFALLTGLQPPRGVMESALDAIRGAA